MTTSSVLPADITVLHVADCPSVTPLLERLEAAATLAGLPITTTLRLVESDEDAVALDFPGSPTMLIDGADPFPTGGGPSYGCRLYEFEGRIDGAPSTSQLTAALLAAAAGRARGPD